MESVEEIPRALFIGIAVASVLLHTYRYVKGIELFTECLVLLKKHSSKLKENKRNKLYALVYYRLFNLYCFVGDCKNAIHSGERAFPLYKEIGQFENAAALLAKIGDLYQFTGEQGKAKETYEKALTLYSSEKMMFNLSHMPVNKRKEHFNKMLVLTRRIGDREREGWLLNQLGVLSLSLSDYPEAKEYFEKELAISKETGNRKEKGKALRCLGNLYRNTEEYQQAKHHYEEAIAILEEAGEIKEQRVAFGELGKVYSILREFQNAKTLQQKAFDISVKIGDKDGEIIDYRSLADIHASLGEYDEAKECYAKALAISKELSDRKGEALTYNALGKFYRNLKDFKKAENYYKKTREIYKELGDLNNEGFQNNELGDLYHFLGKFDEAIKCLERALVIKKRIGDRRGEGAAYCNLGTVHHYLGDYGEAKECNKQAMAIFIETNYLKGQAVNYANFGTVHRHLGDYDTAYEFYKKALEVAIRTGNSEGLIVAYSHLGVIFQHLGKYVKAEKLFQKALAISKEIGDKGKEADALSNVAYIEKIIGEPEKAKAFYEQALQISKEVGDIKLEAKMNCNLGTVYQELGDVTKAKTFLQNAMAVMKQIERKDGEHTALNNLGTLHTSVGEYAKARKCYEQALEISKQTADKMGEMIVTHNLGLLHAYQFEFQKALECFKKALLSCEQMGDVYWKSTTYFKIALMYIMCRDVPKALSYLSVSINILEEMRGSIGDSEFFKLRFADERVSSYQLMVTVLLTLGYVNQALSISELARARSLAELMACQYSCQHLPGFDPNQRIDFEFANVVQKKSCTGLSFYFVQEHLSCWIINSGKVEVVTNEGLAAEIRPQGASIQDWLESLANQCYRKFLLSQEESCEDRSLLLWDKNTEARSPSKGEEGVKTSHVTEQKEEGDKEPQAIKDLYNIIIAPVHKFLKGSEIIIVSDRSLNRVPFAALMDESGEYLSEKFRIRFIPSLTTLKLIQDSPANYHSQTGVLIVGDPEVGLPELCPPLPCAREEAEMIGRLLNVRPLTGKQATKQAVLQKINSVSLIHIAAHGNADRGDIALAPAQHIKGKPKKEDFVLTMSDISQVQLRAKLVVLSCCHSGLGQIKAEGVVGIARAFLGSGARSVLVSLWAVDDSATMQFMKQFYGHLVRGRSAGESLHETMKWMRGNPQYREVRKWAPFMLIGDDVSFNFKK